MKYEFIRATGLAYNLDSKQVECDYKNKTYKVESVDIQPHILLDKRYKNRKRYLCAENIEELKGFEKFLKLNI